ncbi:MAG TPA: hypothetical protein VGV15_16515 [Terriglobales bacterium]|nr:hypothetical protein [Terriglobales bacterium]
MLLQRKFTTTILSISLSMNFVKNSLTGSAKKSLGDFVFIFSKSKVFAGLAHKLAAGTYVLQKTGNIAAVMNSMGHSDVKTAMTYQHPELNVVRDAINSRHISRHTAETVN